jgi:hypothetical protein
MTRLGGTDEDRAGRIARALARQKFFSIRAAIRRCLVSMIIRERFGGDDELADDASLGVPFLPSMWLRT